MFINAAAEFPDAADPCRILSAEHKRLVCDYIRGLAEQAGAKNPGELSKQLNLLIEGAIVCSYVGADEGAAERAKTMAKVFLHQALLLKI